MNLIDFMDRACFGELKTRQLTLESFLYCNLHALTSIYCEVNIDTVYVRVPLIRRFKLKVIELSTSFSVIPKRLRRNRDP